MRVESLVVYEGSTMHADTPMLIASQLDVPVTAIHMDMQEWASIYRLNWKEK